MEVVYGSKHLSFNKFSSFPLSSHKHTLRSLVLGNNHIFSVRQLSIFEHIKELDLRRNVIASFDEIDEIAEIFSNLTELRINDFHVFEKLTSEEMTSQLIGRLVCEPWVAKSSPNSISKPNGTFLSQSEITNAELYFISKVRSGHFHISNTERWKQLEMKYDIHESTETQISGYDPIFPSEKLQISTTSSFREFFYKQHSVVRLKDVVSKHIAKNILHFSSDDHYTIQPPC